MRCTVHPRVCGEHNAMRLFQSSTPGSSPRVRGTLCCPNPDFLWNRFIPACAGNTSSGSPKTSTQTVHPRVCGEHTAGPVTSYRRPGSSPRVRGTLPQVLFPATAGRFIPACAGNTWTSIRIIKNLSVHPRVCGEHRMKGRSIGEQAGSSPRVRGTLWMPQHNSLS